MIDLSANSVDHVVVQEALELAGDAGDGFVAIADKLFYDKDFQLWRLGVGATMTKMTLGIDYRFVFKVPIFRSQDTVYSAYAGVEILTANQGSQYLSTYRSVGAVAGVNKAELVQFHQSNSETERVNFLGLLTPSGAVPDALRLQNQGLVLQPTLIAYSSAIGAAEKAAHELNFSEIEIVQTGTTEVVDASSSQKGVIKLAGDLEGTADLPRVKGLADKLDTAQAAQLYLTRPNADRLYATELQGQIAMAALPASEAPDVVQQVGDARYVRSVNGLTPDQNGNVTVSGGSGGGGSGGGIDGGIF